MARHKPTDDQLTLFGQPEEAVQPSPGRQPFDPAKVQITEHEGEPCVLETDLGEALGYGRVDYIIRLISRLEKRPSWGPSRHRDGMVSIGSGARRAVRQRLLTEKQVVLTCMACKLSNFDEVQSLIADVFIAWRHGRLRAADAHTEVQLQEATDQAIDQMPAFFVWAKEIADTGKAARAARRAAEQAARTAAEIATNQRRPPLEATVRISTWVIKHNYRDYCPCCERVKISPNAEGTQWAHMKGKYRREVLDGWFVCAKCNREYENSKNTQEIYIAFIAYVRHVEAYLAHGRIF